MASAASTGAPACGAGGRRRKRARQRTAYRGAESPTLLGIIESLWLQIGPYFHVLHASENWHAANSCHRAILEALRRRHAAAAAEALRHDIDEAAAALELILA